MDFCSTLLEIGLGSLQNIYHSEFFYLKAMIKLGTSKCQAKVTRLINGGDVSRGDGAITVKTR
jgi:hypothetical protein